MRIALTRAATLALTAIAALLVATAAHARTLTLWPRDFSPLSADSTNLGHEPGVIISNQYFGGGFAATVDLPIGTTITGLKSSQYQTTLGCRPTVSLTKKKFAGFEEYITFGQPLVSEVATWQTIPIDLSSPAIVQNGYLYWVQVNLPACSGLYFGGIRVIYE